MTARWQVLLGGVLMRLLGVFLLAVVAMVLIAPREPNVTFRRPLVVFVIAVLVATLWAARHRMGWPKRGTSRRGDVAAAVVTLLGTAITVILALALRYDYTWDPANVSRIADARTAATFRAYSYDYFSRYPNNIGLLVVDKVCQKVGAWFGLDMYTTFIILVNGVCLAAILGLVYLLVRMLHGSGAGLLAQSGVLLLIGLSPWMAVPYTDILVAPIPVAAVALAALAALSRSRRLAIPLVGAALLLLAAGTVFKPTILVGAIALMVWLVFVLAPTVRSTRSAAAATLAVAAALGVLAGGVASAQAVTIEGSGLDQARLDPARRPPIEWWILMGTRVQTHEADRRPHYGGYDRDLVNETRKMSPQRVAAFSRAGLKDRLEELGPLGYLRFLSDKAAWTWGDGLFTAWGEGLDAQPGRLHDTTGLGRDVAVWNHPSGSGYQVRADLTQGLWVTVLLIGGVGLLRARPERGTVLLALNVLGIAAFILLFQGRSRYLLCFVPVVIALAATVADAALAGPGRGGRLSGKKSVTGEVGRHRSPTTHPAADYLR